MLASALEIETGNVESDFYIDLAGLDLAFLKHLQQTIDSLSLHPHILLEPPHLHPVEMGLTVYSGSDFILRNLRCMDARIRTYCADTSLVYLVSFS